MKQNSNRMLSGTFECLYFFDEPLIVGVRASDDTCWIGLAIEAEGALPMLFCELDPQTFADLEDNKKDVREALKNERIGEIRFADLRACSDECQGVDVHFGSRNKGEILLQPLPAYMDEDWLEENFYPDPGFVLFWAGRGGGLKFK